MTQANESQRRIRHITSIQIRNLTPYPARDVVTTSPVLFPNHLVADDMDIAMARRRSRRISSASALSLPNEDDIPQPRRAPSRTRKHSAVKAKTEPIPTPTPAPAPAQGSLQRHLEEVVSSRLIETFITLSIPPREASRPPSPAKVVAHRRTASSASTSSIRHPTSPTSPSRATPRSPTQKPPASPRRAPAAPSPKAPPNSRHSTAKSISFPSPQAPPTPPRSPPPTSAHPPTPFYLSRFHRPSTNPKFDALDPEYEYAAWADLSGSQVVVCIWGRTEAAKSIDKGKGRMGDDHPEDEWTKLNEWEVDLDELVRVPPQTPTSSTNFLPNTLCLTVSGETCYLPQVAAANHRPAPHATGHLSDTDIERVKTKELRKDVVSKSRRETKMMKGASWGDLIKLVTLQTVLGDTQESLNQVVRSCDKLIGEDQLSFWRREISEREETVQTLVDQRDAVRSQAQKSHSTIAARQESLKTRRSVLAQARDILDRDRMEAGEQLNETSEAQNQHADLLSKLPPSRISVLQTLSDIFPIDPLEPRDLLFSILSIPLPIPVASADPAPPLILNPSTTASVISSHSITPPPSTTSSFISSFTSLGYAPEQTPIAPEDGVIISNVTNFNDESVAAALGYAAQLVQLISAYTGMMLIYPVTCVGSRSLIKDPISAMMGPRMFPLYSRGVDTYRFEYGVFLLNKNIEMLMGERNLRALDMRHTLPNLKNLLLTLTSGAAPLPSPRPIPPIPLPEKIDQLLDEVQPTISTLSSTSYNSTMPSVSKQLLSPLAAMLRARYPSSVRVVSGPAVQVSAPSGSGAPEGTAVEVDPGSATEWDINDEPHPHTEGEEPEEPNEDDKTIGGHDQNKFLDETEGSHNGKGGASLEKLPAIGVGV